MTNDTTTAQIGAHARFMGAPWYGQKRKVLIGGVGSIGSWLALNVVRAGHDVAMCDMDTVSRENLGGQLYGNPHLGRSKVGCMIELLNIMCDTRGGKQTVMGFNNTLKTALTKVAPAYKNFMFSCFDNVDARKLMFNAWKEATPIGSNGIFIDGRLSAESFHIYAVRPVEAEIEAYETTLYANEEVQPEVCSYKATTHMAMSIASDMMKIFNNHLTNTKLRKKTRTVPRYIFREAVLLTDELIS